jgi:hypothetical protein
MENAARLYRRQNHPQKNAQAPDIGGLFTRLTAVFRFTRMDLFNRQETGSLIESSVEE